MNTYKYENIYVGLSHSFQVRIDQKVQDSFSNITGDINPLHRDAAFAKRKGYEDCVVFGMLTASYYSTLAGVYLPGENSLLHGVDAKFLKPVFVGDILTVEGKVSEKNDAYKLLIIKASICNQNGEKVSRGIIRVGVLE